MFKNVTLVFGIIVCFLGILLVWLIYYFSKSRDRSDSDYQSSLKLSQRTEEEKRLHPRVDINLPISMETPEGTIGAEIKNISIGGAFICCKKPLPLGEVFSLTILPPDNEPIAATARVIWSNVNVPEDKVVNRGMGVRFIKMSEKHIQLVRQITQKSD